MRRTTLLGLILGSMVLIATVACGSSDDGSGTFNDKPPGSFGDGKNPGAIGGSKPGSPAPDLQACAKSTATADALPLQMVVLLDKSGSMCEFNPANTQQRDCKNASSKWQQATTSLGSFFGSADSKYFLYRRPGGSKGLWGRANETFRKNGSGR